MKYNPKSLLNLRIPLKGVHYSPKTEFKKGNKNNLGKHWKIKDTSKMSEVRKGNTNGFKKGHSFWFGKKRHNMIGTNNPAWIDGRTPQNIKIRNSSEGRLWVKSCMIRDSFTCQKTGQKGGELVVHYINNFSDFPELRMAIDNGITLSKKAHIEFHKEYGKRNNTKEQLEEFINK